jgi:copper chaperone CopZ
MMEKLVLTIPTIYGDHHTSAVKDILAGVEGVTDSYVSSAFQQISVSFDPKQVKPEAIRAALAAQGYSEDEQLGSYAQSIAETVNRHTAALSGTGDTLAFAQATAPFEGRPLWPCPGLNYQSTEEDA